METYCFVIKDYNMKKDYSYVQNLHCLNRFMGTLLKKMDVTFKQIMSWWGKPYSEYELIE